MTEVIFLTEIRCISCTRPFSNLLSACRGQKEPQVHKIGCKKRSAFTNRELFTSVTQTQVILQFVAGMSKKGKLERLSASEAKVLQNRHVSVAV